MGGVTGGRLGAGVLENSRRVVVEEVVGAARDVGLEVDVVDQPVELLVGAASEVGADLGGVEEDGGVELGNEVSTYEAETFLAATLTELLEKASLELTTGLMLKLVALEPQGNCAASVGSRGLPIWMVAPEGHLAWTRPLVSMVLLPQSSLSSASAVCEQGL